MDEQQIFDELNQSDISKQFSISAIPAHTHNGTDSQPVSFSNLTNRYIIDSYTIAGTSAATAGNYSVFFLAPYNLRVLSISEVHTAAGNDAGAVSLNIEKLTGTTAAGSGTTLLSTAFNLKGTINTVQNGLFLGTLDATRYLLAGNRLAFKLTGTPTSVANVTISLVLEY